MKLKSILLTGLFAATAALSFGAQAASDMAPEAKSPAVSTQADKATPQKKHSHVEEKTGMQQKMPETMSEKPSPAKDMTKHSHPRDGK